MLAYDVVIWEKNNVVRYIKTLEHSLNLIRAAFRNYEIEILTSQEQIDKLREDGNVKGSALKSYLEEHHRIKDSLNILQLPHEHVGKKGDV